MVSNRLLMQVKVNRSTEYCTIPLIDFYCLLYGMVTMETMRNHDS